MKLRKTFDIEALKALEAQGYLHAQKHPQEELYIYNYAPKTQYEAYWNEITLQCRGLILTAQGAVVARPFPKFFNLGERIDQVVPDEPFEVYEKMDGSLGILYHWNGKWSMATRGSFGSEQAQRAQKILNTRYAGVLQTLDQDCTYLMEIIYPENRIVVNYGAVEDLVLLAIMDNATAAEKPLADIGFPLVKRYDGVRDIHQLGTQQEDNKEGFVVRFKSGLRLKIKFEEYVRIHRIVTQVSNVSLWECLKDKKSLDDFLERVPDEFYQWVKRTHAEFLDAYAKVEFKCKEEYKVLGDRKETALYFMTCTYPNILFAMLDAKDYAPIIWKMLRPKYSKPFAQAEE